MTLLRTSHPQTNSMLFKIPVTASSCYNLFLGTFITQIDPCFVDTTCTHTNAAGFFVCVQCSKTCGHGSRSRESYCMNNLGRRLADRECGEFQRVVTETCNDLPCPQWTVNEWSEVGLRLHTRYSQTKTHKVTTAQLSSSNFNKICMLLFYDDI